MTGSRGALPSTEMMEAIAYELIGAVEGDWRNILYVAWLPHERVLRSKMLVSVDKALPTEMQPPHISDLVWAFRDSMLPTQAWRRLEIQLQQDVEGSVQFAAKFAYEFEDLPENH